MTDDLHTGFLSSLVACDDEMIALIDLDNLLVAPADAADASTREI